MSLATASGTAPAVLQARGLVCGYGRKPVTAPLDLALHTGEIVALLGSSGCGKSTLLRVLSGLQAPLAGRLEFEGRPLDQPHPRAGLLFQRPGLLPWLSCAANVGFGLGFRRQPRLTRAERAARVEQALTAVGLRQAAGLYPAQLSGGMAQRAALARALARQPLLLLADEPFSALDPINRQEMRALLRQLVHESGTATLLVTHDVDEALGLADRILLLGRPAPALPAQLLAQWQVPDPAPLSLRDELLQAFQSTHRASDPQRTVLPQLLTTPP